MAHPLTPLALPRGTFGMSVTIDSLGIDAPSLPTSSANASGAWGGRIASSIGRLCARGLLEAEASQVASRVGGVSHAPSVLAPRIGWRRQAGVVCGGPQSTSRAAASSFAACESLTTGKHAAHLLVSTPTHVSPVEQTSAMRSNLPKFLRTGPATACGHGYG